MTSRIIPQNVFDQFTFFSLLIPGLFTFALMFPLAPQSLFSANVAWAVVLLLAFSFVVGAIMNVFSEVIIKKLPFMDYSADIFHQMVVKNHFPVESRDISTHEENIIEKCIQKLVELDIAENKPREKYTRHDTGAIYQFLLNKSWRTGGTLPKLHLSIRMMNRSLSVISIIVVVCVVGLILLNPNEFVNYDPFHTYLITSKESFLLIYSVILSIIAIGSVYGQKRYAGYFILYAMMEFIEQTE